MRLLRIVNADRGTELGARIGLADRWGARLRGLLGRPEEIAAAVAYLAFATAFGGETLRVVGAIAIILLGLALIAGGLAERLSRKSPAQ